MGVMGLWGEAVQNMDGLVYRLCENKKVVDGVKEPMQVNQLYEARHLEHSSL
jgi:hypothetical protein